MMNTMHNNNTSAASTYIISSRKLPVILFLLLVTLLMVVYFCWESLYQERTIVQILKASATSGNHEHQSLEEWLEDLKSSPDLGKADVKQDSEHISSSDIKLPRFYELNISTKLEQTKVVLVELNQSKNEIPKEKTSSREEVPKDEDANNEWKWPDDEEYDNNDKKPDDDQAQPVHTEITGSQNDTCASDLVHLYNADNDLKRDEEHSECRQLAVIPQTLICLYTVEEDIHISSNIRDSGIWEGHIVKKFQELLQSDASLGVIDVGANLGMYSLIAASMGHNVLAIEPNLRSIRRINKALVLQGTQERVQILQNAVTDQCGVMELLLNDYNQGDTRVKPMNNISKSDAMPGNTTNSITLNDLVPYLSRAKHILKLDIQGFEHKVLQKAARLFDTFNIPYIFMEWVLMREFYVTDVHESQDKDFVLDTLDFLAGRNYIPFSSVSQKLLDRNYWFGWPEDVLWVHDDYLYQVY